MQSIGARPPILHDSVGRAATRWAVVIWSLVFYVSALGNVWTAWLAARRDGQPIVVWQVLSWELSSATAALLLLPAVVWLCARWPLHADVWGRRLPAYVMAALGWWLLHVAGMVVLRMLVYALAGAHYDFGGWLQWVYELSKDLRTFALLVAVQHALAWYARRRQGEAHLLAAPDEGPPVEPLDRPERFLVRKLGRDFLVATADIEWIQASGNYVNLHVRGHDYPLRSTMAAIEAKLDPAVSCASTAAIWSIWGRCRRSSRPIPATHACICAMPACCRAVAATWPVCVPMPGEAPLRRDPTHWWHNPRWVPGVTSLWSQIRPWPRRRKVAAAATPTRDGGHQPSLRSRGSQEPGVSQVSPHARPQFHRVPPPPPAC